MMNSTFNYILARLKEPSTWAGIAVFIGMFGLSEDTISRIVSNGPAIVTAVGALIAIFAPSQKKTVVVTASESLIASEIPAAMPPTTPGIAPAPVMTPAADHRERP